MAPVELKPAPHQKAELTDHYAILKWAAGSLKPLPPYIEFDQDVLIDLLTIHNLSGRFLHRLSNQTVPWVTPPLKQAALDLHSKTRRHVIENARAVREVNRYLGDKVEIIIVKGISTYILSGNDHTMRSGDIDVLCNDSDALIGALTALGYHQSKAPFLYEIGEYSKDGIEFDIHSYFPVYTYSESLANADLVPGRHPAIWRQSYQMQESRIFYADLKSNSYRSEASETEGLIAPNPHMLALILCSHAFLNYTNVWSISHREKAYVRLGEIADLFDLADHPDFRREKFLSLVEQLNAGHAVAWAASVATSIFGKNPLPMSSTAQLDDDLPDGRFPCCLWWNFWAGLRFGADDLLARRWLDMALLVKQLGGNTLGTVQGVTGKYSTFDGEATKPLRRLITLATAEDPVPLELEVRRSEHRLQIDLRVMSELGGTNRVRVDFGNVATEWIHSSAGGRWSAVGAVSEMSLIKGSVDYKLRFEFSWEVLGEAIQSMSEVPVLIGVAKQSEHDGLTAGTLIPVSINFEESLCGEEQACYSANPS